MRNISALSHAPRLLLLDMDDTLVDTEGLNQDLIEAFFLERGRRISQAERDIIPGASVEEIFETICPGEALGSMEEFFSYKARRLSGLGVATATGLEALLALPIPKVIVSGSAGPEIVAVFAAAGLDRRHFEGIYPIERYGRGKPHPAGYAMARHDAGVLPGDCLVLEDSHAGVASALAAGCEVVYVTEFTRHTGITKADYEAATVGEVAAVLGRLISATSGTAETRPAH
jgi:beta-phosphoglucomutase-like phosphatase (HAD superfamily)